MVRVGGGGLSWWCEMLDALAGGERWYRMELLVRVGD